MKPVAHLFFASCAGLFAHGLAASSDPNGVQPRPPPAQVSAVAGAQGVPVNSVKKVVLVDDTVTDAQLRQIRAKGYRPEAQARGNEVYYCRRERSLGTRFETKVCKTSGHILQDELQGKEVAARVEKDDGNKTQR
jgi:hypothetical protein